MTSDVHSDSQRKLHLVVRTGLTLTATFDLETIVRAATDAGLELCGAQLGAFFHKTMGAAGESQLLYLVSGIRGERFSNIPVALNTSLFTPILEDSGVVRCSDISNDPRFEATAAHREVPEWRHPVRSYLAVPVKAQSGEVLGRLVYGHIETNVFEQESEDLVLAIAGQAAVAIENARLRDALREKIASLEGAQLLDRETAKRLGELAAIVETSQDAIISKDLNGIVTSWNDAAQRIFGYTADEMIGKSILTLIPPHLHDDERMILRSIRAGRRVDHFETVRLTKSGEAIEVALTISPIKDARGEIVGASKILRDISSRKRMEQSLVQAEKIASVGRMAATIAHEINNPLEAITNLMYLLRPAIHDPSATRLLDAAESELSRVSHIARQTLGFYRENASAGRFSLSELVNHAITIYGSRCANARIEMESSLQSSKRLAMRRGEILQVISNLVANAIYAMPDGGNLHLSTRDVLEPTDGVVLTIGDTGSGIPPANLPHVFDAFFTTRKTVGTGIGLFIAKQFVESHGGKIHIKSDVAPGASGTEVSIFLPATTPYEKELRKTDREPNGHKES